MFFSQLQFKLHFILAKLPEKGVKMWKLVCFLMCVELKHCPSVKILVSPKPGNLINSQRKLCHYLVVKDQRILQGC